MDEETKRAIIKVATTPSGTVYVPKFCQKCGERIDPILCGDYERHCTCPTDGGTLKFVYYDTTKERPVFQCVKCLEFYAAGTNARDLVSIRIGFYLELKTVIEIMRRVGYKWPRLTVIKLCLFNRGWEEYRSRLNRMSE